jgi:hypothetical protein
MVPFPLTPPTGLAATTVVRPISTSGDLLSEFCQLTVAQLAGNLLAQVLNLRLEVRRQLSWTPPAGAAGYHVDSSMGGEYRRLTAAPLLRTSFAETYTLPLSSSPPPRHYRVAASFGDRGESVSEPLIAEIDPHRTLCQ